MVSVANYTHQSLHFATDPILAFTIEKRGSPRLYVLFTRSVCNAHHRQMDLYGVHGCGCGQGSPVQRGLRYGTHSAPFESAWRDFGNAPEDRYAACHDGRRDEDRRATRLAAICVR